MGTPRATEEERIEREIKRASAGSIILRHVNLGSCFGIKYTQQPTIELPFQSEGR